MKLISQSFTAIFAYNSNQLEACNFKLNYNTFKIFLCHFNSANIKKLWAKTSKG